MLVSPYPRPPRPWAAPRHPYFPSGTDNPEGDRTHVSAHASSFPPIGDYGLIGDCHAAALVSKAGSIDWCCMPRFDSGSVFGRLLDWDQGGYCSVTPIGSDVQSTRRYLDGTLVLETTFASDAAEARLIDCFTMRQGGANDPYGQILRVLEGVRGRMAFDLRVTPRFDYGEVRPWIRRHRHRIHSAVGGNDALVVAGDG